MTLTSRRIARLTLAVALPAVALATLSGCGGNRARLAEVRTDLTPELYTPTLTKDESDNLGWISLDRGMRDLRYDFIRFWHADRGSRLSPDPLPY